jgi:hypothetical protein
MNQLLKQFAFFVFFWFSCSAVFAQGKPQTVDLCSSSADCQQVSVFACGFKFAIEGKVTLHIDGIDVATISRCSSITFRIPPNAERLGMSTQLPFHARILYANEILLKEEVGLASKKYYEISHVVKWGNRDNERMVFKESSSGEFQAVANKPFYEAAMPLTENIEILSRVYENRNLTSNKADAAPENEPLCSDLGGTHWQWSYCLGAIQYADGVYVGKFVSGLPNGLGVLYSSSDKSVRLQGTWRDGKLVREEKVTSSIFSMPEKVRLQLAHNIAERPSKETETPCPEKLSGQQAGNLNWCKPLTAEEIQIATDASATLAEEGGRPSPSSSPVREEALSTDDKKEVERLKAQLAALQAQTSSPTKQSSAAIRAERRVALVIGNARYPSQPLKNPTNDARDVAARLSKLNFKVFLETDLSLNRMRQAVRKFADEYAKSDVGLVYYSGHGIETRGSNYLIPVNADIRREYELTEQAYPASQLTEMFESIQNVGDKERMAILILDACRNNDLPRAWRSVGKGLARMDAPKGTFISFATAPGSVAADGMGRNSPFTKHLLLTLNRPNLSIEKVFKEVRIGVVNETNNEQVPWESSSLMGDFYFNRTK